MQPLRIVNVPDKPSEIRFGVGERLVVVELHLLPFQRLEETLGFGIIVRVSGG